MTAKLIEANPPRRQTDLPFVTSSVVETQELLLPKELVCVEVSVSVLAVEVMSTGHRAANVVATRAANEQRKSEPRSKTSNRSPLLLCHRLQKGLIQKPLRRWAFRQQFWLRFVRLVIARLRRFSSEPFLWSWKAEM